MTTLEKELDDIVSTLLFPARYAKSIVNGGTAYPPYNVIKIDDQTTVVELAVAGFKESELNVVVEEGNLKISGKKEIDNSSTNYLYKGIGTRAFEKMFGLSKDARVEKAEYSDGILSVFVTHIVPEVKKPNEIPINRGSKIYLTENAVK
jgi:molecular chaperone IbpA